MDLQADGAVLSEHFSQAEGHGVLKKVTDCLWYLEVDKKLSGKLQEKDSRSVITSQEVCVLSLHACILCQISIQINFI